MLEQQYKEISEWSNKLCLYPISTPQITCDDISKIDGKDLTLEQFEDLINKIASYNLYIKSQKGSIEAQIQILEPELSKITLMECNGLGVDYKFKTKDEKIAIVRSINPEIDSQHKKLAILKAQLARIKDIPYAIDKKIDILKSVYHRKISEQYAKYKQ